VSLCFVVYRIEKISWFYSEQSRFEMIETQVQEVPSNKRMSYLFRGVGQSSAITHGMERTSSQRMAVLLLYLMMPLAVTSEMEIRPSANMPTFFSIAGLVIISAYMTFFPPVSYYAGLFVHALFFILCQIVASMSIANGITPPQMILSFILGWCVAYGLFGDGTFGSDAIRFPFVLFLAMVVSELGGAASQIVATFLLIDAFLAVVHANTVTPGAALTYIAFAGLVDLWIKISSLA
jgi:hypothetical protein